MTGKVFNVVRRITQRASRTGTETARPSRVKARLPLSTYDTALGKPARPHDWSASAGSRRPCPYALPASRAGEPVIRRFCRAASPEGDDQAVPGLASRFRPYRTGNPGSEYAPRAVVRTLAAGDVLADDAT
jgi:hypothetical protein